MKAMSKSSMTQGSFKFSCLFSLSFPVPFTKLCLLFWGNFFSRKTSRRPSSHINQLLREASIWICAAWPQSWSSPLSPISPFIGWSRMFSKRIRIPLNQRKELTYQRMETLTSSNQQRRWNSSSMKMTRIRWCLYSRDLLMSLVRQIIIKEKKFRCIYFIIYFY